MDRKTKAFTGELPCSSSSRIQFSSKEAPPTESLVCKKIVHGGNHVSAVSAVPNAESNKDLVVDNPKPNL